MKTTAFFFMISLNTAFAALPLTTNSVTSILERYHQMETNVCSRIQASSNGNEFMQEESVYLAGYIHSKAALPVLLGNLEIPSNGKFKLFYADLQGYKVVDTNGTVLAHAFATHSRYPEPPSPAFAALTQIPCDVNGLLDAIEDDPSQTNRVILLAWLSAVHDETRFFEWLGTHTTNAPAQWSRIREYASTNLVGRKPYSMKIYRNSFEGEDRREAGLYDGFVRKLRDIAHRAESAGDSGLYSFAIEALNELGADIEDLDEGPSAIEFLSF